jgi:hypothetical protein
MAPVAQQSERVRPNRCQSSKTYFSVLALQVEKLELPSPSFLQPRLIFEIEPTPIVAIFRCFILGLAAPGLTHKY